MNFPRRSETYQYFIENREDYIARIILLSMSLLIILFCVGIFIPISMKQKLDDKVNITVFLILAVTFTSLLAGLIYYVRAHLQNRQLPMLPVHQNGHRNAGYRPAASAPPSEREESSLLPPPYTP